MVKLGLVKFIDRCIFKTAINNIPAGLGLVKFIDRCIFQRQKDPCGQSWDL